MSSLYGVHITSTIARNASGLQPYLLIVVSTPDGATPAAPPSSFRSALAPARNGGLIDFCTRRLAII